jgi:hypothetical protein
MAFATRKKISVAESTRPTMPSQEGDEDELRL